MSQVILPCPEITYISEDITCHSRQHSSSQDSYYVPRLPINPSLGPGWYISADTFATVLDSENNGYDKVITLDARNLAEFNGGHVNGATHVEASMFDSVVPGIFESFKNIIEANVLIVVHCEYSSKRGPDLAQLFRNYDRMLNIQAYPKLTFPETYILEGGYCGFHNVYKRHCVGDYIPMEKTNVRRLQRCMSVRLLDSRSESESKSGAKTPPVKRASVDIFETLNITTCPATPIRSIGSCWELKIDKV